MKFMSILLLVVSSFSLAGNCMAGEVAAVPQSTPRAVAAPPCCNQIQMQTTTVQRDLGTTMQEVPLPPARVYTTTRVEMPQVDIASAPTVAAVPVTTEFPTVATYPAAVPAYVEPQRTGFFKRFCQRLRNKPRSYGLAAH